MFCDDEDFDIDALERTYWRLQADSVRRALGNRMPAMNVPQMQDARPASADWILCWGIIRNFATAILSPPPGERPPTDEEVMLDWTVCEEARSWAKRSTLEDHLTLPPSHVRGDFFDWMTRLQQDQNRCSGRLRWRMFPAWRDAARHAVNLLAEVDGLDRIPNDMMGWLHPRVDLADDRNVDIYVHRHQMFGHGSRDHAVVDPNEKGDCSLLLRIAGGDHPGFGANGGEGSHHYWIKPDALRRLDFDAVELTC